MNVKKYMEKVLSDLINRYLNSKGECKRVKNKVDFWTHLYKGS